MLTQIGGAVGGAGAGAVWSTLLPRRLALHLPSDPETQALIPKIMGSLPFAISFPMDSPIRLGINEAYRDTQRVLNMMAILFLIPALFAVCLMRNVDLNKEEPLLEGVVVLGRASPLGEFFSRRVLFHQLTFSPLNSRRRRDQFPPLL